jgi:alcohol dehydrogenase class IV
MNAFHYTFYAQEVIFAPGSASRLREAVDRWGWRRIMLCTTEHARARGHVAPIEDALGERLVVTYERVQAHLPATRVAEAVTVALDEHIDALLGLGGGSPIGMAKAVSLTVEAKRTGRAVGTSLPTDQPLIPVIAIPTTYAGSEMTPVYGTTQGGEGLARKITVADARVVPKLTFYDPLLTLDLPPRITAGTGINALAHCIEALYSITRNPLSTAAALSGLRAIADALPRCYVAGDDLEARSEMLVGAFLAGSALSNVAMGLHHGLCHVLGGATGAAHGDLNSVVLPHVMRFNLDATAPQLVLAAEAMGLPGIERGARTAGEAAARQVSTWVEQMRLPQRLRALGVREDSLPELARIAFASRTVQNNPQPITDPEQIEALLRQAW